MAYIELAPWHQKKIGSPMAPDVHWIDVRLRDGRIVRNLVVRNGRVISGRADDENGEGDLDFIAIDIVSVKRHGVFWPWW